MDTNEVRTAIGAVFQALMSDRGTPAGELDFEQNLYDGGYGLDSMDAATLSAMLDEHFEGDPYSAGQYPRKLAEIADFYTHRTVSKS